MQEVSTSQNKAAASGLSPSFSVFLKGHSHNAVDVGGTYKPLQYYAEAVTRDVRAQ